MRTTRGLERLVTFVDAIVAIAITLLVLPLVDVAGELTSSEEPLGRALSTAGHLAQYAAFLLSFAVIARLWWVHHQLFERVRAYDGPLMQLTLAWAFTIVVLPFPTSLISAHTDDPVAKALYLGTMLLSSACLTGLGVLVARRPALRAPDDHSSELPLTSMFTTGTFVVALALSLTVPQLGLSPLLLLVLDGSLARALRARLRHR